MSRKQPEIICGVDEVGRGPLAGPVVAAAVILDSNIIINGLTDSKKLTPAQRYRILSGILDNSQCYAVAGVSWFVIDKINILQASLLAMRRAIEKLSVYPDMVYVDGKFEIPGLEIPQRAVIGGDSKIPQVSAASIIAKIARDVYMIEMANQYPEYGFERHKGYGTKKHLEILDRIGPCEIHRRSFKPVSQMTL
ncbi:MAG: ribonuclease HII [candidate division Zixibacteria bacterium]|nr:ribonuclease HII [candidate division Zixibacteria bacterium]